MKTAVKLPKILASWRELIHPAALLLPRPSADEYAELKTSIEQHGMLTPVIIFVDRQSEQWLLDGVSRLQVLVELKREHQVADEKTGRWLLDHKLVYENQGVDPYLLAIELNMRRRQLSNEQKRDVVRNLLAVRPDLSSNAIAKLAGVSDKTVTAVRNSEVANKPHNSEAGNKPEISAVRLEASGRRARGRRPGTKISRPTPKPPLTHCPHCGKPLPTA